MSAAKKAEPKAPKVEAEPKPEKRVVYMVGNGRGHKHGDRRTVDAVRAADLVAAGLARYRAFTK